MGGKGRFFGGTAGTTLAVPELDGVWNVERRGGLLPPLVGVRKRIHGDRGETKGGPLPGARSTSSASAPLPRALPRLRRRARAGRRRRLADARRSAAASSADSPDRSRRRSADGTPELEEQLVKHIDEAYAMEQNVLRMLDGMISTTEDPEIRPSCRAPQARDRGARERLKARLEAHDASPSTVREAAGILGALMKRVARHGPQREGRPERARRLRDRAPGDRALPAPRAHRPARPATRRPPTVARENRKEEEAMAQKIEANWDRFAELSLREAGVTDVALPRPSRRVGGGDHGPRGGHAARERRAGDLGRGRRRPRAGSTSSARSTRAATRCASPRRSRTSTRPGSRRRRSSAASTATSLLALAAAKEAVADAGLNGFDPYRVGIVFGSAIGGLIGIVEQADVLRERGPDRVSPHFIPSVLVDSASGQIAISLGIRGPNYAPVSACATGSHAIGEGGRADPPRRRRRGRSRAAPRPASTR